LMDSDEKHIRNMLRLNWLHPQTWITDHAIKLYCLKLHTALEIAATSSI